MSFNIPVEVFDGMLIFVLTLIWKGYRSMWHHIRAMEKSNLKIMLMLHMKGFDLPDEFDTEIFKKANDL